MKKNRITKKLCAQFIQTLDNTRKNITYRHHPSTIENIEDQNRRGSEQVHRFFVQRIRTSFACESIQAQNTEDQNRIETHVKAQRSRFPLS